jgi:hypothetical protein
LPDRLKDFAVAIAVAVASATIAGCESGDPFAVADDSTQAIGRASFPVRVYTNPYEDVDWSTDRRLLSQHHDHVARRLDWILAYDAAGYDVLSLMDYSGSAQLSYALRERPWPASGWVPQSMTRLFKNIELFLPNAEEVGIAGAPMKHATSPFMMSYVEGADAPAPGVQALPLLPNQYRSVEELFTLVRSLGGFPCLAHPWNFDFRNLNLGDSYCVEIYNAQADQLRERGVLSYYTVVDRNQAVVRAWDDVLLKNQAVFAIAVNDHVGPGAFVTVSDKVRDSGKIVVLAKAATLPAYEQAFRAGSFFAVRDYGEIKGRFPTVHSITVTETFIYIETTAAVTWIADGQVVGKEPLLLYADLPSDAHYLRAEVAGPDGSTVYTQAFGVRPVGDVNGDANVDENDLALCESAATLGTESATVLRACAAVRYGRSCNVNAFCPERPRMAIP